MRVTSPAEKAIITQFFVALQDKRIFYCALRNYEGLPDAIGHDLDVFVPRKNVREATALLTQIATDFGLALGHVHERDYFKALFFIPINGGAVLHIDIYHGALTWHGLGFIDEQAFIARCMPFNGMAVPSRADEAATLCLISLIWGSFFKERYRERVKELLHNDADYQLALSLFQNILGESVGKNLLDAVLRGDSIDGHCWGAALRHSVKKNAFRRNPFKSILCLARYWLVEMKCMAFPPGRCLECAADKDCDTVIAEIGPAVDLFGGVSCHAMDNLRRLSLPRFIIAVMKMRKQLADNYLIVLASTATQNRRSAIKRCIFNILIKIANASSTTIPQA